MKRIAILVFLLLPAALVHAETAAAATTPFESSRVFRLAGATPPLPPEWAGIWSVSDTTYDCLGVPTGTSTYTDTLCAGQVFVDPDPNPQFTFDCNGTVTATTVDLTCTGSGEVFTDCMLTVDSRFIVTRTGDSYLAVVVVNSSYSGTGAGCDLFPDNCSQINSRATRIGPAPEAYCATPVEEMTWGRVKSRYR